MADLPQFLTLKRNRDHAGTSELVARRAVLSLVALLALLALLNVFGQSPSGTAAASPQARLEVSAPARVRGGLFFQGRFTVEATSSVDEAVLVLAPGWLESMHVNTIEPAPEKEESRDGRLALAFGPLEPGDRLVVYMQFQVNPTNLGRRSTDVELYDGERLLARVDRTVTVFP